MFVYAKTPTIAAIDGVVTPEECLSVIAHSREKLERSVVATDDGLVTDKNRTSHGTWVPHSDFSEITQRISDIAAIPLERAEQINVLRYQKGQEYKPHYDGLSGKHLENGGQRLLTAMVYLNNAVGGGTAFPKLNLLIGSIGGRLLMFGNVDDNNQPHELSLHQGLPPHEGEKWVMTLWFREKKIL
jgi:prolyl 4-hydroxylase